MWDLATIVQRNSPESVAKERQRLKNLREAKGLPVSGEPFAEHRVHEAKEKS